MRLQLSQTLKRGSLLSAGILLLVQTMLPMVALASKTNDWYVCHSAGQSGTFTKTPTDPAGAFNGHLGDSHQQAKDIIPPFTYNNQEYSQNWDAEGQAIWDNDCETTRIEVQKVLAPANDPGLFDLKIEGQVYAENVGNGGSTGEVYIKSNENITVRENQGGNTSISDYTTSIVCKNQNGTGQVVKTSDSVSATIHKKDISKGDDIVCVITNTRINTPQTGSLRVVKYLSNNHGGTKLAKDFAISLNGAELGSPSSTNEQNAPGISTASYNNITVSAGIEYTLTETSIDGYQNDYISCFDTTNGLDNSTMIAHPFTAVAGQTILCNIGNSDIPPTQPEPSTITLTKVVDNSGGGQASPTDFGLTLNGGTVVSGHANPLNPGSYTVDEVSLPGYVFVSITGNGCPSQLGGNVQLQSGQNITCTITNKYTPDNPDTPDEPEIPEKDELCDISSVRQFLMAKFSTAATQSHGAIHGCKFHDENQNGAWDSGEETLSGFKFDLYTCSNSTADINTGVCEDEAYYGTSTTNASGVYTFQGLEDGTYMVCEPLRDGWVQSYPLDTNGDRACWLVPINDDECIVNFGNKAEEPGEVLGETPKPEAPRVLADTGSPIIQALIVSMSIITAAGTTLVYNRKPRTNN